MRIVCCAYGLQKGLNIVKRGSKTYKIMVK